VRPRSRGSLFGRKVWNFPAFSPERLGEYVVREVRVTHWVRLNRFMITINVTASLYNQHVSGFSLLKRLRFGFEECERPFFVRQMSVMESTITFLVSGAPSYLERFKRSAPLLLQSVRNPNIKLRIPAYTFGVLEVPKPDPSDPDMPF
jgi:hypothetical protein